MHAEVVMCSEPDRATGALDLNGDRAPLLGDNVMKWMLAAAQRYIVD